MKIRFLVRIKCGVKAASVSPWERRVLLGELPVAWKTPSTQSCPSSAPQVSLVSRCGVAMQRERVACQGWSWLVGDLGAPSASVPLRRAAMRLSRDPAAKPARVKQLLLKPREMIARFWF